MREKSLFTKHGVMGKRRGIWGTGDQVGDTHMLKKLTLLHSISWLLLSFVLLTCLHDFGELVCLQVVLVLPQAPHQTGVQVLLIAAHPQNPRACILLFPVPGLSGRVVGVRGSFRLITRLPKPPQTASVAPQNFSPKCRLLKPLL